MNTILDTVPKDILSEEKLFMWFDKTNTNLRPVIALRNLTHFFEGGG